MNNLDKIIAWLRSLPDLGKGLALLAAALLAAVYLFCSCTSTRSMSVSVDKAEKVDIHLTDSINGQMPLF